MANIKAAPPASKPAAFAERGFATRMEIVVTDNAIEVTACGGEARLRTCAHDGC